MVMTNKAGQIAICLAAALAATSLGGCATKKFVRTQVGAVDARVTETQGRVDQQGTRLDQLDGVARDALQRAQAAGKLAEGKFNYEVVLTDDAVKFPANKADLSPEAQSRLQALADKLKTDNRNVYIEIQGHTDAGEADRLGQERADAVRRFLNRQGVALNRLGTISYGATKPVSTENTPTAHADNRRVVVMVLA